MSTAPQGFQTPKMDWTPADPVGAGDFNRIEGNVNAIEQGSRTLDPAQAPTGNAGTLRQLLDWIANRIKAVLGTTNWYDAPPTTLQAAKAHIDNTTTAHGGVDGASILTKLESVDGAGSGLDADTLRGLEPGTGANNIPVRDANGKVPGSITGDAATVGGKAASAFLLIAGGNPTGTVNFDAVSTARLVLPVGTDQYAT